MRDHAAYVRAGKKANRKGKAREREFAKRLSAWWSGGKDKLAFRRTPISGGWPNKRAQGDITPVSPEARFFPFVVDVKDRENIQGMEFADLLANAKCPIYCWFDELTDIIRENPVLHEGKMRLLVIYKNRRYYCIVGTKELSYIEDNAGFIPHLKVRHRFPAETLIIFHLDFLFEKDPNLLCRCVGGKHGCL